MLNTQPPNPGYAGGFAEARGGTPSQAAGRVYVADSLGSVAGGALFSFVLVRFLDHIALLAVPALLNLAAAAWLGRAGSQSNSLHELRERRPPVEFAGIPAGQSGAENRNSPARRQRSQE